MTLEQALEHPFMNGPEEVPFQLPVDFLINNPTHEYLMGQLNKGKA